ncbi:MAG: hybrid sensor histidine kinase/response regulator [Saprospiraceae bacterium]|nr:MAG: hybrid sensor histidine kinase/response regulator [Saprospiraceae bacterium]
MGVFVRFTLLAQPGLSSFVHYSTDQGLSSDFIKDITKDQLGFLWVATLNGLNRFDGHNFRQFHYDPVNPASLPDNFVKNLTLAPDGSIWTTGNKGVCRIDPATLEFRRFILPENEDSLNNDGTGKVLFDEWGRGWVNGEKAMHSFDLLSGEVISYPIDITYAGYYTSYLDRSGKIWLIDRAIISYFDTKTKKLRKFATETPENPMVGAAALCVAEDQCGKLWVTSWFKGLATYDPALDSLLDYPDGTPITTVILPDVSDIGEPFLWLGGGVHGLFIYYPETGESLQFPPDPQDPFTHNNYIASSLFKDQADGSIWIGTEAGLEHYAPTALRFGRVILPVDNKFGQFSLMSGAIQDKTDPSGHTYFIAMWGSGWFKWNKKQNTFVQYHTDNSGLKNNGILCSMQDRSGYIWAGTEGVSRFDPHTGQWRNWECYSKRLDSKCNVLSCLEDRDGRLWFGTNIGGLFYYNPEIDSMEEVELPGEAYNDTGRLRITNMCLDGNGNLWLANYNQPINFDPNTRLATLFEVKNAEADFNQWSDVLLAANGRLYATSHDCLLEMDINCRVLRKFNLENGLHSNQVYYIEQDRQGRIWCNSSHLLHCLDPATGNFTYYGTADGLFKNIVTDGLNMTADGMMFVGFQNAFNYFDPALLRRNLVPPPVVITETKVMNQPRNPTVIKKFRFMGLFPRINSAEQDTLLVINPGEDIFSIEFAALNFNQPTRNRYAYKLEGFNTDWVYTDLKIATYTNLDEGEYLFRVKAANNDGIWNETGAHVLVKVIPVMVKRWYFQVSMVLLTGLILFGIWHYRSQQRQRLEAFRESLARDLHDEMGSTLSSIRFFSEFAKQQVGDDIPEVTSLLQRISISATNLSESMQDIVWAMKRKNDQLEDLATRMTEFGLRLLEARDVAFKQNIGEGFSGKSLPAEVRRNLYLIFKEAVNNAAKYADATVVELSLNLKKGILLMEISDNGKGFNLTDTPAGNGGNGLQNMQKRAEEIGGTAEVYSEKDIGTRVVVKVKL